MKSKPQNFLKGRVAALGAFAVAVSSVFSAQPASAVVLEQKWQAGQQLVYDVNLNGTMHLTAPAEVPMIGGLPLEFMLKGDGQSTLAAHSVDEFGTAIVAMRLDRMQLKANETTFNQNVVLGIRDGRANVSMNGQPVMPTRDVSQWLAPRYGVRVTKQLRAVGTSPIDVPAPANPATEAEKKDDANPMLRIPLNMSIMLQAMMARSLPALWPTRDVAIGDTWKADVQWPQPPNAPRNELQKPAGEFNLKAVGEEEVLGRKTLRVAVDGGFNMDSAQARIVRDEVQARQAENKEQAADNAVKAPGLPAALAGIKLPLLDSLTQKVKGDIWFDAAAGQIVRTDLQLTSDVKTRKDEKTKPESSFDFSGNVKMELRKVSYEGQPNAG